MATVLELNMLEFLVERRVQVQGLHFLVQMEDEHLAAAAAVEDQGGHGPVPGDPLQALSLERVEERGGHQEVREVHGTLLPASVAEESCRNPGKRRRGASPRRTATAPGIRRS